MILRTTCLLAILIICSCLYENRDKGSDAKNKGHSLSNVNIGVNTVTDELAGAAYRKRAKAYFIIADGDSSDFICYFTESKNNGRVDISFRTVQSLTYKEHLKDLKDIFTVASKDFNFDSLKTIGFGRLVNMGDLAVKVTKEYALLVEKNKMIKDYCILAAFLKSSSLGREFNQLFEPYALEVDTVFLEKAFFTDRSSLYSKCKLETDTALLPQKILDCMTWLGLEKKKSSKK